MYLRTKYELRFETPANGLSDDLHLVIRRGEFKLLGLAADGRSAEAVVTVPVDPRGLSIWIGEEPLGGGEPTRSVEVPEKNEASAILRSAVRILSFAIDNPSSVSSRLGEDELIPENAGDEDRLVELGCLTPHVDLKISVGLRGPRIRTVDDRALELLLEREVGLALYSDAAKMTTATGAYREFWRVLESAFGQKDASLLRSIVSFEPARRLGFDEEELRRLHVLRGRASHAESSAGLEEYQRVSSGVEEKLPRVRALAEQVLLTKAKWGSRGLGEERIGSLPSYVDRDGVLVMIRPAVASGPEESE